MHFFFLLQSQFLEPRCWELRRYLALWGRLILLQIDIPVLLLLPLYPDLWLPLNISLHSLEHILPGILIPFSRFLRPMQIRLEHLFDLFIFILFLHLNPQALSFLLLSIVSIEFLSDFPSLLLVHNIIVVSLVQVSHFHFLLEEFLFSLVVHFGIDIFLFLHVSVVDLWKLIWSNFLARVRFVWELDFREFSHQHIEICIVARLSWHLTFIFRRDLADESLLWTFVGQSVNDLPDFERWCFSVLRLILL